MLTAIIYESNTGYTAQYAKLLSEKTGLPCVPLKEAKEYRGKDVVFLGWLMAGTLKGIRPALRKFNVAAAGAVGMASNDAAYEKQLNDKNCKNVPLFYLQGGFDMNRLKGVYKSMMKVAIKSVNSRIEAAAAKGEQPDEGARQMQQMVKDGGNFVCEGNLAALIAWCEQNA